MRAFFAVFFLITAFLKAFNLPHHGPSGPFWTDSAVAHTFAITLEIALAMAIICEVKTRFIQEASICVFTAFLAANISKANFGGVSCNCFGTISVPLGFSIFLNSVLLVILFWWRGWIAFIESVYRDILSAAIISCSVYSLFFFAEPPKKRVNELLVIGDTVVIDSTAGIGEPFYLLKYTELDTRKFEKAIFLIYNEKCQKCQKLVEIATDVASSRSSRLIAIICTSECSLAKSAIPLDVTILDSRYRWVLRSPEVVIVENNKVVHVSEGLIDGVRALREIAAEDLLLN